MITAIAFAVSSAGSASDTVGRTPPVFESRLDGEDDADYRPLKDRRGLFAHGYSSAYLSDGMPSDVPCLGTDEEQETALKSGPNGDERSEYWFYSTGNQAVLFRRVAVFNEVQPCAEAPGYKFEVQRAFRVDGVIYSFKVGPMGKLDLVEVAPDGETAYTFNHIRTLFARVSWKNKRNRRSAIKAGVHVECWGQSGPVWDSMCAAKTGPAKGMVLYSSIGDDADVGYSNEIRELNVNVRLSGKLFEIDREWRGKDLAVK